MQPVTRQLNCRPFLLLLLLCTASHGWAQGTRADYERARELSERTRNKVFRDRVEPNWYAQNRRFWYRNRLGNGHHEFIRVNAKTGKRQRAFPHKKLATSLGHQLKKDLDPRALPIDHLRFDQAHPSQVQFKAEGKFWVYDRKTHEVSPGQPYEHKRPEPFNHPRGPRRESSSREQSPDQQWTASIRNHNLHLQHKDDPEPTPLTTDGVPGDGYRSRFYWSPDSQWLVCIRRRDAEEHKVHMVESSPRSQVQPKLHTHNYLKPGDRIARDQPRLFDVSQRREVPLANGLFRNPWSLSRFQWNRDSSEFAFLYNQRGHQVLRLVGIDPKTGGAREIIREVSPTFVDYAHKVFSHYLPDTGEMIWMSERDGWNHLYLYDIAEGTVKNQITRGNWVVRKVDWVDEAKRQIWFQAGGIDPDQNPYYLHYCRINFDGTGWVRLTEGNGTHRIEFSPDGTYLIDTWSRTDQPPVNELRRTEDGALVCNLERADWSALLDTGWKAPEPFVAKGRDGKTDIHGLIFRPTNLDPDRSYPVIESIYAGPHSSHVPSAFSSHFGQQSLAEIGFVLVKINGMGTSHRSKAFHDVCWKNLKDAGFPDRILWMKAAADKYPYMDITRVGIYGGSAGGQSTAGALFLHPEFYKVGVADCGCHDNRMDKIWWNELWMSWPVGDHYRENSNVTHAGNLQGKLFLTVGELDRNVDPASTLQVVDALIRADKDFDLVIVPGAGHGVGGSSYLQRRRTDYFVRHLLGVEPRWNGNR